MGCQWLLRFASQEGTGFLFSVCPSRIDKLSGAFSFRTSLFRRKIHSDPQISFTFAPISSTFKTTSNTSGCPAGFVGKFGFNARLTDKNTSPPLSNLLVKVTALSNGNLLQNADGGPAGVGATLTVPKTGGFADAMLSPGQFVDVPFVICLKTRTAFSFFVDVMGVQR